MGFWWRGGEMVWWGFGVVRWGFRGRNEKGGGMDVCAHDFVCVIDSDVVM